MTADVELLTVYDEMMRGAPSVPGPGVVYESDGPLVRAVGGFRGFVFGPRDTGGARGAALGRLIARQRDRFAERGETAEWRVHGHDEPPELPERLREAGFRPGPKMAVMVGESAPLSVEPVLPEGVVLRRVTGGEDMRRIAALHASVWSMDLSWLADMLTARVAAMGEDAVVLTAEHQGEAVCAAWMFLWPDRGYGGLRGGTTLPAWRSRGVYRALVAERARAAAARGVPYLQVDAMDDSLPILRRLGFSTVTTMVPYVWTPPAV